MSDLAGFQSARRCVAGMAARAAVIERAAARVHLMAIVDAADRGADEMRRRAQPPRGASPEIPAAIARGPQRVLRLHEVSHDGAAVRPATVAGRHPVALADAFDIMADQARRRGGRSAFTVVQVATGRLYAALAERLDAAGVRCSSVEALGGRGGGGEWIDAVIADSRSLEAMRAAVGAGVALDPRRARAGARRISDRALVDAVCLDGLTLGAVLRRFGWSANRQSREALVVALASALDRMQGPAGSVAQHMG